MKKIITTFLSIAAIFIMAISPVQAEEVCTQSYGQPVVCGVKLPKEEHIVVEAGLKENLQLIGISFIFIGGVMYVLSNKKLAQIK